MVTGRGHGGREAKPENGDPPKADRLPSFTKLENMANNIINAGKRSNLDRNFIEAKAIYAESESFISSS